MFVRNPSKVEATLMHGHLSEEVGIAALVVPQAYRITAGGLVPLEKTPAPAPRDPPDTSIYAAWDGVAVTVAGHVEGPTKPPFARQVEVRVGEAVRRMAVFGDRVWERSILGGGLAPSAPQPFDRLELSLERAFGGGFDVPPGLQRLPGMEELPHPGYRRNHDLNPKGVGLYPDERAAAGAPLPNFERPDALLQRWNDSPEPAAFSPCRDLVGWRAHVFMGAHFREHVARGGTATDVTLPPRPLRLLFQHAPPELIFDALAVGTRIEVDGLSGGSVRLDAPPCRVRIEVEPSSKAEAVQEPTPRFRSLHIDTDRALLLAVHDLPFRYNPRRAPKRVRVARVSGVEAWSATT